MLAVLGLMFAAMWFWKTNAESTTETPIPYSTFYNWAKEGKIESVVLDGEGLIGKLKGPETVNGKSIKSFHSNVAPNDLNLLPILHEKEVRIEVKSQQQPFGVQVLMTLLPWVLIIGVWVWMSRRAKGMLGAGGPFGAFMGNKGRKFDKATSVQVTFEEIGRAHV